MPEASSVRKPLIDYCGRYKEATYRVITTQRGREIAIQRLFYLSFTALLCSLLAPELSVCSALRPKLTETRWNPLQPD